MKSISHASIVVSAFALPLLLAEFSYGAGETPSSNDLWAELRRNGPAGWAALMKSADQIDGTAVQQSKSLTGARPDRLSETHFKINGAMLLFDITKIGPAGQRANVSVGARNSRYSFTLGKSPDEENWQLEAVGSSQPSNPYLRAKSVGFLRFLEMPWTLLDVPIADMLADKSFKPIQALPEIDSDIVEYTFSFDFPVKHRDPATGKTIHGSFASDRASMRLDPSRHWLMQSYRVHGKFETIADLSGTLEGELEYQDIGQVAPIIKRVVTRKLAEDMEEGAEVVFEITEATVRDIPEAEFKLTAYGFPEVGSVEELRAEKAEATMQVATPNMRITWIIANIALVVFFASLLVWKKRRVAMSE